MRNLKTHKYDKDVSSLNIIITFVLLVVAICGYLAINKYIANPVEEVKDKEEATADDDLTDQEALEIAEKKYLIAVASLSNTSLAVDKIYNAIKTQDVILTDQILIDNLNKFGTKTYAANSTATIVKNYDEAITDNFTDEFISQNVLTPNGFIGKVGDEYYIIKEKMDNYFFKESALTLLSKNKEIMTFTVVNTNYDTSCAGAGETVPSITCTTTVQSSSAAFKMILQDKKWKISELNIVTK